MEKPIVSFNEARFNNEVEQLKKIAQHATRMLRYQEAILGKICPLSLSACTDSIRARADFLNIEAIADLCNIKEEYLILKNEIPKIEPHLKSLEFVNDRYLIPPSEIERIKEENTIYLREDRLKDYNALKRAVSTLNKYNRSALNQLVVNDVSNPKKLNVAYLHYTNEIK